MLKTHRVRLLRALGGAVHSWRRAHGVAHDDVLGLLSRVVRRNVPLPQLRLGAQCGLLVGVARAAAAAELGRVPRSTQVPVETVLRVAGSVAHSGDPCRQVVADDRVGVAASGFAGDLGGECFVE